MEINTQRVLAYQTATILPLSELDDISGGQSQFSTRQTVRISSSAPKDVDVMYDIVADV